MVNVFSNQSFEFPTPKLQASESGYFDGNKLEEGITQISEVDKNAMLSALEGMSLTPETINKFVPGGSVLDVVNQIETRFNQIFQVK